MGLVHLLAVLAFGQVVVGPVVLHTVAVDVHKKEVLVEAGLPFA